ncbi:MAG: type IX secretion system sortase PorU [Bacteroidia bacterium]
MRNFWNWTIILGLMLIGSTALSQRSYTETSVLSQGTWYKLALTSTGVYKLDQSYLQQMGINVNNIDPRNIQMFGHDGGMLPQLNGTDRHDDLAEMSIEVTGQDDGSFDNGDAIRFYARGPHVWNYNSSNNLFRHSYNLYSDSMYVFLHIGNTAGKRVAMAADPGAATYSVPSFRSTRFHEDEQYNILKSGRFWMGEKFDLTVERNFTFNLPDIDPNGAVRVTIRAGARSGRSTRMRVSINGGDTGDLPFGSVSIDRYEARFKRNTAKEFTVAANSTNGALSLDLTYDKSGDQLAEAWLDWIEVDYDRAPNLSGENARLMTLTSGVDSGAVASLTFQNASSNSQVWDVTEPTEPKALSLNVSGGTATANIDASVPRHLLSFSSNFSSPASWRTVANQNLHQKESVDYLIITHPLFRDAAEKLAAMHAEKYNQTTKIVYPSQIYNEFSSGTQDVTAIRDYIKMIYDRSGGSQPEAVCLLGDGTYDYKNITKAEQHRNFVLTYQSRESDVPTTSYTSDDFFGFMEANEGNWGEGAGYGLRHEYGHTIDVPIGRLPVETSEEANDLVNKLIAYVENPTENFGDWRQRLVLVGDYKELDGDLHMRQADSYAPIIQQRSPNTNIDKIYLDNYPSENTAGGLKFPDARRAMLDQFDRGALFLNYTGHGGENAWSNATLLSLADIEAMKNGPRQPCVVTATCEFGRWDDHTFRSGGELFLLKGDGGAIAMFTTVRLVYSYPNKQLNTNFYKEAFTFNEEKGRMPTVGEIMMKTKNTTFQTSGNDINSRNFTLLGDPGLVLAYPRLKAAITAINDIPLDPTVPDTLRSLGKIRVEGVITDDQGNAYPNFNGDMAITVFDKPNTYFGRLVPSFDFQWQNSRIFNGNVSVVDGAFSFEFVTPLDVSYQEGKGKISLYFHNEEIDGGGAYDNLIIGGTAANVDPDNEGPTVQLFMNDEFWKDGGTTGPSPYLYAKLFDESGINTATGGIGHELISFLDGNEESPIVLNEYYTATQNDYRAGTVYYQLKDLEEGNHTLTIRVWDVANNLAEASTDFIVTSDAVLAITEIMGFPSPGNPADGDIGIVIGHNFQGRELEAEVRIMSADGKLLRTLTSSFLANSSYYRDIKWNGESTAGHPVPAGLYVFDVVLRDPASGRVVRKANKMVVIR